MFSLCFCLDFNVLFDHFVYFILPCLPCAILCVFSSCLIENLSLHEKNAWTNLIDLLLSHWFGVGRSFARRRVLSTFQYSSCVLSHRQFRVDFCFLRSINRITTAWWHERRCRRCRRWRGCCTRFRQILHWIVQLTRCATNDLGCYSVRRGGLLIVECNCFHLLLVISWLKAKTFDQCGYPFGALFVVITAL